jgi:asparaginyl-tRNA synthetase
VVGELAGGSVREWDPTVLESRLSATAAAESLAWYVNLRRQGSPRSVGFGLGVERLLQVI